MKNYKYYYIYVTKNVINEKQYVGFHATNNLNDGYIGSGVLLHKKIEEYGVENFKKEILEFVTKNNWSEKETYWIKKLKTYVKDGGYNLTLGGDGTLGNVLSEETKEKIRIKAVGRKASKKTRKKISIGNRGKIISEKTKKALSKPRKTGCSEERKRKISEANKGKPAWNKGMKGMIFHSEETKQKKRIANSGKNNPMYGKKHSKESIKKMSENSKGKSLSEEHKEKIRKKLKVKTRNFPITKCPYCGKEGKGPVMKRFHFNNCKKI
jgi:hypothetical protein